MAAPERWFDDLTPGAVFTFGDYAMSEAEIIAFATAYDPQSFHLDHAAAEASIFGGLIASGWHSTAAMMRMLVDHFIHAPASLGSPGVDEIRWVQPVRPGDRLRLRVTILEAVASRSRPDRGVVKFATEMLNARDAVVMTVRGMLMLRRRPVAD